jgi:hypothetical protein
LSLTSQRCQCRSTGHLEETQCILNSMENSQEPSHRTNVDVHANVSPFEVSSF